LRPWCRKDGVANKKISENRPPRVNDFGIAGPEWIAVDVIFCAPCWEAVQHQCLRLHTRVQLRELAA